MSGNNGPEPDPDPDNKIAAPGRIKKPRKPKAK
jgi:hypothetical protein